MKKENRSTEIACQNSCRFSPTTLELCAKTYAHFILSYAVQHTALFTMSLHIIYTRELPAWNCMNENTSTRIHTNPCIRLSSAYISVYTHEHVYIHTYRIHAHKYVVSVCVYDKTTHILSHITPPKTTS